MAFTHIEKTVKHHVLLRTFLLVFWKHRILNLGVTTSPLNCKSEPLQLNVETGIWKHHRVQLSVRMFMIQSQRVRRCCLK